MTPVYIITGFLGSGKTTLLNRMLHLPGMTRTAVIVNEFGEIGIDHDLIETSDESFVQLSNGCLCCRVRSDLVLTLHDLAARRATGSIPPFERVVLETSGLADPASILLALMTDPAVTEAYSVGSIITTTDAVTGLDSLVRYPQSLRQAAVADHLVITKMDLPQARTEELRMQLTGLNPSARVWTAAPDQLEVPTLLQPFGGSLHSRLMEIPADSYGVHRDDVVSTSFIREAPMHAATLSMFLEVLADDYGPDLLRFKGIVNIKEQPLNPLVIHGVQHVIHPPVSMGHWPSEDRRTRMVFIGRRVPQSWVRNLLVILDSEVADEIARAVRAQSQGLNAQSQEL